MDNKELLVKFWDVSHGHATYIKTPNNKHILIDLGSGSYNDGELFSPIIHLKNNYNMDKVDCCLITHPHLDHIDDILNLKEIKLVSISLPNNVDNKKLLENCRDCDKEKFKEYVNLTKTFTTPVSDDKSFDTSEYWGANIKTFRSNKEQSNINDVSCVFVIEYEGLKIVIPGDNEKSSWNEFLEDSLFKEAISNTDIFLASHHGRESGYHEEVMKILNPRLTIISDSKFNDTSYRDTYSRLSRGWSIFKKGSEEVERFTLSTYNDGCVTVKIKKNLLNVVTIK